MSQLSELLEEIREIGDFDMQVSTGPNIAKTSQQLEELVINDDTQLYARFYGLDFDIEFEGPLESIKKQCYAMIDYVNEGGVDSHSMGTGSVHVTLHHENNNDLVDALTIISNIVDTISSDSDD